MNHKPDESIVKHFWIDTQDTHWSGKPIESFEGEPNRVVHAIEYSAYEALNKKVEKLLSAMKEISIANGASVIAVDYIPKNPERIARDAIAECEKDEV